MDTNIFWNNIGGFFLAGSIAGLILFASHFAFNAIDFRPTFLTRYVYGTAIWLLCATIALLKMGPPIVTVALGYWIVAALSGLGTGAAFGIGRIGSVKRSREIKKELDVKNEFKLE